MRGGRFLRDSPFAIPHSGSEGVDGQADLVDPDHVPFLPVALRTLLHAVVAVDAALFHAAGRRVAERPAAPQLLLAVERLLGLRAQLQERLPLEFVLRAARLAAPGEGIVAVEPDLQAARGLARD